MNSTLINANPTVFAPTQRSVRKLAGRHANRIWMNSDSGTDAESDEEPEPIDEQEVFDLIRSISDPEHPLTLEELRVVSAEQIELGPNSIMVEFTPTVPHCGMSTIIGLCIRVRLLRSLPVRFKVDMRVKPGSHQSENAVNKQLNDKERVAAALENPALLDVVEKCLATATRRGKNNPASFT